MEDLYPLESTWFVAAAAGALAIFMLWFLSRSLPFQNLLLIAIVLLGGEALIDWIFNKYGWIPEIETSIPRFIAGAALLWLAIVLACRSLAQFIIEPWKRERVYGFWVLGISAVFIGMFQFGWPYFYPDPIKEDKALLMAAIRGAASAAYLAALSPWLVRKRPVARPAKSKLAQEPENKAQ
jgi:hypothetical protein